MSTQPCGCQCQAIDTVAVQSQGVSFDLVMDAPEPLLPAPLFLTLLLVTVMVTLSRQRCRTVLPSLRLTPSPRAAQPATAQSIDRAEAPRPGARQAATDRAEWAGTSDSLEDLLNSRLRAA